MIHTSNKTERNKPQSLNKTACSDSLKKVIDLSNPEHKKNINDYHYGSKSDVPSKLKNLYYNKCAYCENKDEYDIEVEHYRPKNEVKNESHNGYYWLCYEWTNLLPSCHVCNKANFKGTKFPIDGDRVLHPIYYLNGELDFDSHKLNSDYLEKEKPLLLNPEMNDFDPFKYFEINYKGIFLEKQPKETYEFRQAKTTIEILGLNERTNLFEYRKKNIRKLFNDILKQYYKDFLDNKISKIYFKEQVFKILKGIANNSQPHKEYSFFWSYLYKNFPNFVGYYIKGKKRNLFLKFYNEFKEQNNQIENNDFN